MISRAAFASRNLWVTQLHEEQRWPGELSSSDWGRGQRPLAYCLASPRVSMKAASWLTQQIHGRCQQPLRAAAEQLRTCACACAL